MSFTQSNGVRYYHSPLIGKCQGTAGSFHPSGWCERRTIWHSLNMGLTVGDDPEKVARNREISFEAVGRPIETLSDSWLVHSHEAFIYDQPRPSESGIPTKSRYHSHQQPGSQPVHALRRLRPDPVGGPGKAGHWIWPTPAGWERFRQVGRWAVEAMQARYGSRPQDILAAIGPSIGPERYEVGPEVVGQVQAAYPEDSENLLPRLALPPIWIYGPPTV